MILPPFNGGQPFVIVKYEAPGESKRYGIIVKRGRQESSVWLEFDILATSCQNKYLTMISLPAVPTFAYTEKPATIGGIGKHVRWNVIFPNRKWADSASLRVNGIDDRTKFTSFVENIIRPFGLCHFEFERDDDDSFWKTIVEIPDGSNVGLVAAALHCGGYGAVTTRPEFESGAKLAIERYDRSEHMWWNQDQDVAGPLRDMHRWVFDFLPSHFTTIPFTWQSLCANIHIDPLTESRYLPLPLRDFYLSAHIKIANEENDVPRAKQLEVLRGRPSVTCRLSLLQNQQLLSVAYWSTVAPFDKDNVFIARLVRFRFMLHGYTSREIGGYKQTANYLGHGALIRNFRNKPQYRRENLSSEVLNHIYKVDGTLRGSGFKGTRGKYGHQDFPQYKPQKRMKRSATHEGRMREIRKNVFADYKQAKEDATNRFSSSTVAAQR